MISSSAVVDSSAIIGEGSMVWHNVQVREFAIIGKNCILGKNVYIDHHVCIGDNVKIGNNVSIFHGVKIEDNVFIAPHVCFINDKHPRSVNVDGSVKTDKDWKVMNTLVRNGASIGANATILCGIIIGEGSVIGCGSVVTKDVLKNTTVVGNPAKILKRKELIK